VTAGSTPALPLASLARGWSRALVAPGLFLLFVALAPREPWSGDAAAHSHVARALGRGGFDVATDPPDAPTVVRSGRRYATASPAGAFVLLPAALAARSGASPCVVQLLESASAALLCALTAFLFFGWVAPRAGRGPALTVTLGLLLATGLFGAARIPDGSALATLLLLVAVRGARSMHLGWAIAGGIAAGLSPLADDALFVPALICAAAIAGRGLVAGRLLARVAAAALPFVAGTALAVLHRRLLGLHTPLPGDLAEGVAGLLVSSGKGLFLFSPVLLLLVWALPAWLRPGTGHERQAASLTLIVSAALVLALAGRTDWHGDPAWGPRRLAPLLPLLGEPIALWLGPAWRGARAHVRAAIMALALAGFSLQLAGAAFSPASWPRLLTAVRHATGAPFWFSERASESHFIPHFSPISGHLWMLSHYFGKKKNLGEDAPFKLLVPGVPKLEAEGSRLQIDWWLLPPRVIR
jgi:hypothetical protein